MSTRGEHPAPDQAKRLQHDIDADRNLPCRENRDFGRAGRSVRRIDGLYGAFPDRNRRNRIIAVIVRRDDLCAAGDQCAGHGDEPARRLLEYRARYTARAAEHDERECRLFCSRIFGNLDACLADQTSRGIECRHNIVAGREVVEPVSAIFVSRHDGNKAAFTSHGQKHLNAGRNSAVREPDLPAQRTQHLSIDNGQVRRDDRARLGNQTRGTCDTHLSSCLDCHIADRYTVDAIKPVLIGPGDMQRHIRTAGDIDLCGGKCIACRIANGSLDTAATNENDVKGHPVTVRTYSAVQRALFTRCRIHGTNDEWIRPAGILQHEIDAISTQVVARFDRHRSSLATQHRFYRLAIGDLCIGNRRSVGAQHAPCELCTRTDVGIDHDGVHDDRRHDLTAKVFDIRDIERPWDKWTNRVAQPDQDDTIAELRNGSPHLIAVDQCRRRYHRNHGITDRVRPQTHRLGIDVFIEKNTDHAPELINIRIRILHYAEHLGWSIRNRYLRGRRYYITVLIELD